MYLYDEQTNRFRLETMEELTASLPTGLEEFLFTALVNGVEISTFNNSIELDYQGWSFKFTQEPGYMDIRFHIPPMETKKLVLIKEGIQYLNSFEHSYLYAKLFDILDAKLNPTSWFKKIRPNWLTLLLNNAIPGVVIYKEHVGDFLYDLDYKVINPYESCVIEDGSDTIYVINNAELFEPSTLANITSANVKLIFRFEADIPDIVSHLFEKYLFVNSNFKCTILPDLSWTLKPEVK